MAGQVGNEDGDVGFQIAPMVDVVFVLMLFFMASAGLQVVELELGVNLPSGRSGAGIGGPPPTPIIVEIGERGQITLNKRPFDTPTSKELPELRAWFKETIETYGSDDPVIIRPDPGARHGRIIDVLSAASASGVRNLTFS